LILQNVETGKLQEAYNRFVGRILKENTEEKNHHLSESKNSNVIKTGDNHHEENNIDKNKSNNDSARNRMLSLAGIAQ
jgi:hypothetical protein